MAPRPWLLVMLNAACWANAAYSAMYANAPDFLRTCDLENPLGMEGRPIEVSWRLTDHRRGARQTAYQIQVAARYEDLLRGRAGVWDSGRVASNQSVRIRYGGPEPVSRQRYYWRVRTWGAANRPSDYSKPAFWEMGLLNAADWKALWIARHDRQQEADLAAKPQWISAPGEPTDLPADAKRPPARPYYFRFPFHLDGAPRRARLLATANEHIAVSVNGRTVEPQIPLRGWQTFKGFTLDRYLVSGDNVIALETSGPGTPTIAAALLHVTNADGSERRWVSNAEWRVSARAADGWREVRFTGDSSWARAVAVGRLGEAPWPTPWPARPASYLRKNFTLAQEVQQARVYVTALGSYQLHINGSPVGRDLLTPDWTDYRKRVLYQTYDVSSLLRRGQNVVAALLGDGWYASGLGWQLQRYAFGPPPPRFLLQLELWFANNARTTIATDDSWQGAESPVQRSEIYAGETYDARLARSRWDQPEAEESGWERARTFPLEPSLLAAQQSQPTRITEKVRAETVRSPRPGVYVFDMGQNMVGWVRLRPGRTMPGQQIQLRFGESLREDGSLYTQNLRAAEATDLFIAGSDNTLEYRPHFTFHGFRYVEATGFQQSPALDAIEGEVFHTDAPFTGSFTTSNNMVNQLWRNIRWGQRGNLIGVPTDCPQRDERLGWMADAEIFWRTALYNMDLAAFTRKFTRDMMDAQSAQGAFSDVSPRIVDLSDGAPAWGDAGVIVPWTAWRQYGDLQLVRSSWAAMERWMDYLLTANPNFLWLRNRGHDFGDWVPAGSETPKDLIATAYWAYDAQLMTEMAKALGDEAAARRYADLRRSIGAAFEQRFVQGDGTVGNGSQTCYALALHMALVPERLRAPTLSKLVEDIERHDWHLTTGFVGTPWLMQALSENQRSDVAYRLLLNQTYPSWGYMIAKGATTIWERWNGDRGDPAMNSLNHYAFGSVGEWLYRFAAGIDWSSESPGFQRFIIRPEVNAALDEVNASYDSQYGRIAAAWKLSNGGALRLRVLVPPNTSATIHVPSDRPEQVLESGRPVGADSALVVRARSARELVVEAGAGEYEFSSAYRAPGPAGLPQ